MTKEQKTAEVATIVHNARRWYERDEFLKMVREIWNGLDIARDAAIENAPKPEGPL